MKCLDQITELREAIESGMFAPGEMVGTEFDFSQRWGVSRNTVRKGVAALIGDGLLERRPGKGLFVRGPHSFTRVVQIVVPNLAWPHCVAIARGAQAAGRERGVQVLVYDAHGKMALDLEVVRRLPGGTTDGAIIVSLHHRQFTEVLFELKSAGYPFVLVDQKLYDLEAPTVEIDNYGGGYLIGQKLAELGHRRIIFVGTLDLQATTDRLNGLRDGLNAAGIPLDPSLVMHVKGEGLEYVLQDEVLAQQEGPLQQLVQTSNASVIFDGTGDLAPNVYRAVRRAGLRIPEDISVVTFEDSPMWRLLEPSVACLRQPWSSVGQEAFEILMEQVGGHHKSGGIEMSSQCKVMKANWVPGASLTPNVPN